MFMQQFCGINVIAYYSTQVFIDANFSEISALAASLGYGIINVSVSLPLRIFDRLIARKTLTAKISSGCLLLYVFAFENFVGVTPN